MTSRHRPWLACLLPLALAACQRDGAAEAPAPAAGDMAPPSVAATPAAPAPDPDAHAAVAAPALQVTTVDGKPWDLAAHRGQWVVVNFWATWCAPCLKEMPELSALDAMREHVAVIGLAYEEIEPAALRAFLVDHPVVYPVAIVDVYAPPADFATPRGLPTTYLIGPDGRVAKHFVGPVTAADIDAAIAGAGGPRAG
jgi:thiol-disulfide isomerase/thioredoxin